MGHREERVQPSHSSRKRERVQQSRSSNRSRFTPPRKEREAQSLKESGEQSDISRKSSVAARTREVVHVGLGGAALLWSVHTSGLSYSEPLPQGPTVGLKASGECSVTELPRQQATVAEASAAPKHRQPQPVDVDEWRDVVDNVADNVDEVLDLEGVAKSRDRAEQRSGEADALRDKLGGKHGEVWLTLQEDRSVVVHEKWELKPPFPDHDLQKQAWRKEQLDKTVTVEIGPETDYEVLADKLAAAYPMAYPAVGEQVLKFEGRPLDEVLDPKFYERALEPVREQQLYR